MRIAALVLAAGAGSRFGGDKLAAPLAGRPLLAHVVDALTDAGIEAIVVVLRPGASAGVRAAAGTARIVENDRAGEGLSTSLRAGFAALLADATPPDRVVVALGDQPALRPEVVRALLAALDGGERPVAVPAYAAGGGRNPVALAAAAFGLVEEAAGDAGLGPVLAGHPELVVAVPVGGANPDVDTPADLARLASG